ncbi:hypothetical protein QYE76_055052 [Lolium multiflorum]|uniref:Transposase (putative) gypsy type domain-containing protein n=1 Tax=Lolium multiflorum TaxID=4521 RepID=A0AAD8WNK4_LOLMU|nr:hypothetical protein QYE76_055052 [Lolium multiflorum]
MSSSTPPPAQSEPIAATPITSAPPPLAPVRLDPAQGSKPLKEPAPIRRNLLERSEWKKRWRKWPPKNPKAQSREGEVKGQWWPCSTSEDELHSLEAEDFLRPGSWRVVSGAPGPAPEAGEWVLTNAPVEHGFSLPPSDFFSEILEAYKLQPHNISPNSILAIDKHVALCEGHLRVKSDLALFQFFFSVKKETVPQTSSLANYGSITFKIRPGRIYPHTDRHESVRYWSGGFFYVKDVADPASPKTFPAFKDGPVMTHNETSAWTASPHISESPAMVRMVRRICKMTESELSGKDLTLSWFTKRIQPLQHHDRLMYLYNGHDNTMCATKDNISSDALDKRLLLMIKIPRDVHSHSLKESHENETKLKKELEDKHAQEMSEMAEKLKNSNNRVKTLASKLKAAEAKATDVDKMIFHASVSRVDAYEEAGNTIEDLIEACQRIAQKLSLKKGRTTVIDTMTKLMKMVSDLIRDWQESSARGAAVTTLAMCKAHFPAMDFARIVVGVPKATNVKQLLGETRGFDTLFTNRVDHSSWYEKHDLPAGFAEDEQEDEEESSGSSAHQSGEESGDRSAKDSTYHASDGDKPESSE